MTSLLAFRDPARDIPMDQAQIYCDIVKRVITKWAEFGQAEPDMENVLVFDEARDNYVYIYTGWIGVTTTQPSSTLEFEMAKFGFTTMASRTAL